MSLYPTFLLYEGPIGGSEKCQCKRGACYCVTVTGVNVTGVNVTEEACTGKVFFLINATFLGIAKHMRMT